MHPEGGFVGAVDRDQGLTEEPEIRTAQDHVHGNGAKRPLLSVSFPQPYRLRKGWIPTKL